MNTLLGELATLNDVQYPRYRLAFKLRKLQKNLYLEYGDVGMLSEILHLTGLQRLRNGDTVPLSQLSSVLSELYGAIRTARPILKPSQLQQAQDWAYNWLQLAYRTGSGEKIEATHLKLTLCLFMGSKVNDKARFIFGLLTNVNGAIEKDGLRRFVRALQQLGHAVQENVYEQYKSLDDIFQESLIFVRDSEDVEEEQLDGGIRRQWLSQFEFTKLLSASPPPPFFSWLLLWFALPAHESVVHSVRCSICTRKPILCFRYQCTQCHNYNMCQMCFLKGRTSDRHQTSHKVLEFASKGRVVKNSWHQRLLGLPHKAGAGGRVVSDEKRLFSFRPELRASRSSSNDETDTAVAALTDVISNSQKAPTLNGERKGSHSPAIIRIGSNGRPAFSPKKTPPTSEAPAAHTLHTFTARRISGASGSSSPDSLSSAGGAKFLFEGNHMSHSSSGYPRGDAPVIEVTKGLKQTSSDSTVTVAAKKKKDLTEINKRLSMQVDEILMDFPSPPSQFYSLPHHGHRHSLPVHSANRHDDLGLKTDLEGIHKEESQLKEQVSQLTDKREKLSHELQDLISQVQQMQVGFQTLGHGNNHTRSWARLTSPTSYHARCDSAPIHSPSPTSSSPDSSLPPLNETEVSPEPTVLVSKRKKEREPDAYRASVYTPDLKEPTTFHDPLSEFHNGGGANMSTSHDPADHRYSVAW